MIRVLVVDDDPVIAHAHARYVDRVVGFETVAEVHDGESALQRIADGEIDLVLLDLKMPGIDGIEVCRRLRERSSGVDVLVISSARDLETVREALRYGAVHYLLKPFAFAALREKLESYAGFQLALDHTVGLSSQSDIDAALASLRRLGESGLPKNISAETLTAVVSALRGAPEGLTAAALGESAGVSRVSARRYLEFLCGVNQATKEPVRMAGVGRPCLRYRWIAE